MTLTWTSVAEGYSDGRAVVWERCGRIERVTAHALGRKVVLRYEVAGRKFRRLKDAVEFVERMGVRR